MREIVVVFVFACLEPISISVTEFTLNAYGDDINP